MRRLGPLIAAAALLAPPATAAEPTPIEEWLSLVGWDTERLAAAASESPFSKRTRVELLALARRFARLPDRLQKGQSLATKQAVCPLPPGAIIELTGRAIAAQPLTSGGAQLLFERNGQEPPTTILAPEAPQAWLERGVHALSEPASLRGIVIAWNADRRLVVTPRVAWRPISAESDLVSLGAALLGQAGMDVGLLDKLTDGKPLASDDAEPFYQALAACRRYQPGQLIRVAGENLPTYKTQWQRQIKTEVPRRSLAAAVTECARNGHYSVAPLFNDARRQRGELVTFEGTVRRAVRIDLTTNRDGQPSRVPKQYGVDHYFELELFPADSQNLPLVFCVLDLPEGFPVGDAVQQRARLAGFFLKRWAYRTRKPTEAGGDRRQLAPLLVGPGPVALTNPTPPQNDRTGLLAGVGFVGVVAIVAAALWRQSRSDRRFERSVLSRYTTGRGAPPDDRG